MRLRILALSVTILCLALSVPVFADTIIYDDGPTNGTIEGFFIDGPNPGPFSQSISDGFIATASGNVTHMDIGIWVPVGETPTTVSWWLGTSAFAGDISSGTDSSLTYDFLNNAGAWDVYEVHVDNMSGFLTAGNSYFLTLGNGNDNLGDQFVAWDMNNGPATCYFAVGGVEQGGCGAPGEAFTLYSGSAPPSTPEPGSILLFGTGVLGLAGVLRRKLF